MPSLYVLIGDPVAHSLSPRFQNAAFAAAGIDARYESRRISPAEIPAVADAIRARTIAGANVTIPHKLRALEVCDTVTPEAREVGAVNWLGPGSDGELVGDNTDARGLVAALREAGIPASGSSAVVLGAGGAARAAVIALLRTGARRVVVGARRIDDARALAAAIGSAQVTAETLAGAREVAAAADLIVSAVPATAWEGVAPATARAGAWLVDMAYGKDSVPSRAWADSRGLRSLDGLPMLLHQGAISFEQWLRAPFPMAAARAALGLPDLP